MHNTCMANSYRSAASPGTSFASGCCSSAPAPAWSILYYAMLYNTILYCNIYLLYYDITLCNMMSYSVTYCKDFLQASSVKIGTMQRRLAWPCARKTRTDRTV